ncbi:di-heme oxidoredictase family protein [Aliagarivorans taiwanensis]|uniref:di-heme oxidoreductase family protein n=1 Tax=Aliagarivorans taiwanensis TaxID=561966 RepID=UPI0004033C1F|nr:di-heme oxidoredictase family protein [Aliagarivorans taiwanensis]
MSARISTDGLVGWAWLGAASAALVSGSLLANPALPGGGTTTSKQDQNAFSMPASNLGFEGRLEFSSGNSFFRNPWVVAPATTIARDGLGPLFNTNGCQNCHIKDGRGHVAEVGDDNAVSMLVRISIPATSGEQREFERLHGTIPEPNYGGQIQDQAIPGVAPEARVRVSYSYQQVSLADGSQRELRRPELVVDQLGYGPMHPDTLFSLRVAPAMIGLGLLESISETDIMALADPQDSNNDGIRGIANLVWDIQSQDFQLGRFGWKSGQPSLRQQNAAAFNGDIGITSAWFASDDCSAAQADCLNAASGGAAEVSENILDLVEFYTQHLAVPKRRNLDEPQVSEGDALFSQLSCDSCHVRKFVTAKREDRPALSEQTIYPYTDLLLHDMGEGLSDGRPEYLASGQHWRTPPLWGIGLQPVVNGHSELLHDGRARNVEEAIFWHGGEAQASRDSYMALSQAQREALLAFVNSL